MFTFAYHAPLRVEELVLSKGNSPTCSQIIQVEHIAIQGTPVILFIKDSKINEYESGTNLSIQTTRSVSCPFLTMTKYL